ncbi:MAG TPA: gluconate 2-dehydrogenase subunit 3 family protein [Xanthobacteraceae bacterium]|nr:gluconate 2-dehydrogenase subunit 3 family protein [Xanthobacteraceae bacterium]
MSLNEDRRITRREAIRRVSALLGGVAFVGGSRLLAAVENASPPAGVAIGEFTVADIAFLDEIAETILPETKTPGAKAAKTGAFMALMVTDCYWPTQQKIFRDGMGKVDAAMKKAHNVSFMQATPAQRIDVLTALDREQKRVMDAHDAAERKEKGLAPLPVDDTQPKADPKLQDDQNENLPVDGVTAAGETPKRAAHYFRMMKELALLGYFTSEIGCTVAMRYIETPGRFDPCVPYKAGELAWVDHA